MMKVVKTQDNDMEYDAIYNESELLKKEIEGRPGGGRRGMFVTRWAMT